MKITISDRFRQAVLEELKELEQDAEKGRIILQAQVDAQKMIEELKKYDRSNLPQTGSRSPRQSITFNPKPKNDLWCDKIRYAAYKISHGFRK